MVCVKNMSILADTKNVKSGAADADESHSADASDAFINEKFFLARC